MSADDHGIFTNLRGTVCACGDAKDPGKSFCRKHYFKLPKEERNALYNSTGYVATYRRCLQLLGLQEPKAGDPPRSLNEALSRVSERRTAQDPEGLSEMKHFAQLKRESPFFPIFTDGKAPILPLLQAAKVQLEGSDETDVYFLDWSRCTHTQRTQIADQLSKAFAATSGINPPRFLAWMNSGEGKLPIRVSQTESATIGADMRSFL